MKNKYLKGVSEASNEKLATLAENLKVNEMWLLCYDAPLENKTIEELDEIILETYLLQRKV